MAWLTPRDVAALQQCTLAIHALQGPTTFPRRMLAALQHVVPVEYASYTEVNLRTAWATPVLEPAVDLRPASDRSFATSLHEHPLMASHRRTHDGRALKRSDVVTRRWFQRLALYHEHSRPMGVEYHMACTLPAPPHG